MQRALIIDDERLARNELKKLLQEFPEVEVIGEAANATEGIDKIESLSVALGIEASELLVSPPAASEA
mgnify:CR=1 FL=1